MKLNRNLLNKLLLLIGHDDEITVEWQSYGESGPGLYWWSDSSEKQQYIDYEDSGPSSFEDVVKPVMRWLDDNHHPHTSIYLDCREAELLEGQQTYHNKIFND
jgi:hypothetical protein